MKVYVLVCKGTCKVESEIAENMMYVFRSKRMAKCACDNAGGPLFTMFA
jgi:hypothetical protein